MTVWMHTRRGRIEGDVVGENAPWLHIRLTAPAESASLRARGYGPVDGTGETIVVRREFLTEIIRPTIEQLLDFAAAHPGRHTSNTDMAIRRELGIAPARYIDLLNRAVETPEALRHDPATTHRILRENRAAEAARARRLVPGGVR